MVGGHSLEPSAGVQARVQTLRGIEKSAHMFNAPMLEPLMLEPLFV